MTVISSVCRALARSARYDVPQHTRPMRRMVSTLPENPHINIFPNALSSPQSYTLSLLRTEPPRAELAIGSTSKLPPSPDSLTENPRFLSVLHEVLAQHAHEDPGVISQAQAMASSAGSGLGSGGLFLPRQRQARRAQSGSDGAGGASSQGGAGGGGAGGFIHISDARNPPDYGRIAWPEDIFGSLQVDSQGKFADGTGLYQPSNTYRIVTREGILGLSPFLREKLHQRLSELESQL